jgi:hypothetical protein
MLEGTLGGIHRSQPRIPATPATKVQHEDHRNALDGKAFAEDASAGYGASANVPQVPQVHQSCVRTGKS